jgi:hypothetical protein
VVPEGATDVTGALAAALAQRGGAFLELALAPRDLPKGAGRLVVHYTARSSSEAGARAWGVPSALSLSSRGLEASDGESLRTAVVSLARGGGGDAAPVLLLGPCYAPAALVEGPLQGTQHGTLVSARQELLRALGELSKSAPKQVAAAVPDIIPAASYAVSDAKPQVRFFTFV